MFESSPCGHDAPMYGRYPTHEDQNSHGTAAIRTPTHALSKNRPVPVLCRPKEAFQPTAPIAVGQVSHLLTCAHAARSELYKSGKYDLIITDIMMPEMNGLQLIEQLSNTTPRPRMIAFSGGSPLSQSSFLPLAKDLGASESSPSRCCPAFAANRGRCSH